jgi:hypothetical protein
LPKSVFKVFRPATAGNSFAAYSKFGASSNLEIPDGGLCLSMQQLSTTTIGNLACARSASSASGNEKTVNLKQVNGLSSKII